MMIEILFAIIVLLGTAYTQNVQILQSLPNNNIWFTTPPSISFANKSSSASYTFNINTNITYQTMDGFGASLTDSSCLFIKNNLTPAKRQEVLSNLFTAQGQGINIGLLRQPMNQFLTATSYDDTPNNVDDFTLSYFSLSNEDAFIRPVLDQALQISGGRVKLIGSPWSPPAWMKTGKSLYGTAGGKLRTDAYDAYARFFVKYVQAYEQKNSSLYAITVQNEPLYAPSDYAGMEMSAAEQIIFIRDYLGPAFKNNGINTKIVAYDHNYDTEGYNYAVEVLNNTGIYCDGAGFHTYTYLNHGVMTSVHNLFPTKDIWITEAGSGTWVGGGTTLGMFQDQIMHTIRNPRNWAKGVIFWNVALSYNPQDVNRGLITINQNSMDNVTYETSYYSLGHSSKFIGTGAYRIDSETYENNLESVSYLNPDKTVVLVISNRRSSPKSIKVNWNSRSFSYTLPAYAAATFKWSTV